MALNKETDVPLQDISEDSTTKKQEAALEAVGSGSITSKKIAWYNYRDKPVGGRIAPVLPHLRNYEFAKDIDLTAVHGEDIVEGQIALEAGNTLRYRTCSWQKVSIRPQDEKFQEQNHRGTVLNIAIKC
jgi:hypothetical protein